MPPHGLKRAVSRHMYMRLSQAEAFIDEAEPCRHSAIAMGCTLQPRNKQASIHDVTALVTPALGRPGDEAEAVAEA